MVWYAYDLVMMCANKTAFFLVVCLSVWLCPACLVSANSTPVSVVSVGVQDITSSFQKLMPTTDGSALVSNTAMDVMLKNIAGNMRSMGVDMVCERAVCTFTVYDTETYANVFMHAILGNFFNAELDVGDALAYIRIDTATGLLRRVHTSWWTRIMLSDVLLVLAVVMLAKRSVMHNLVDNDDK